MNSKQIWEHLQL